MPDGWWSSNRSALRKIEGKRNPALSDQEHSEVAVAVLHGLLRVLANLPEGRAAVDPVEHIKWLAPIYPADLVEECLRPALAEAAVAGLVCDGAANRLGRALADGGDLAARAADLTAATRQNALFGTDLTAVVTGPPTAESGTPSSATVAPGVRAPLSRYSVGRIPDLPSPRCSSTSNTCSAASTCLLTSKSAVLATP